MMRLVFFWPLLLCTQILYGQGDGLGLEALRTRALDNSPKLKSQKAKSNVQELKYDNSIAAFLPTLDLSADHGIQRAAPVDNPSPWQSKLSLRLAENLYDNGVSWIGHKSAKLGLTLSELQYVQMRDQVVLDIVNAYLEYSLAEHLWKANADLKKTLKSQFSLIDSQYRQGMKTRKDFLRFRGDVQRTELQEIDLTNRRNLALHKIALLVAKEPADLQVVVYDPKQKVVPNEAPAKINVADSVDAKIFALQQQATDYDITLTRKKNLPQLKLVTDVNYATANYMGTATPMYKNDGVQWGIMLSLEYNLWDSGTRRREIAIALANKSADEFSNQSSLLDLDEKLQKLTSDLSVGKQSMNLAKELLDSEEESFRLIQSEYRQGRGAYVDMVQGIQSLNSARTGYLQSVFSYLSQLAQYKFYEGNIVTFNL